MYLSTLKYLLRNMGMALLLCWGLQPEFFKGKANMYTSLREQEPFRGTWWIGDMISGFSTIGTCTFIFVGDMYQPAHIDLLSC